MITITDEQIKLINDNHNLIYSFLHKYHLSIDENYDLAAIGLCKAAITYDENKACFSTHAYQCMYTSVMHELRKNIRLKSIPEHQIIYYQAEINNEDGKDTSLIECISSNDNVEDTAVSELLVDNCLKKLSDKDRQAFILFNKGYTQNEIGKIIGCSQAQVSRIKKKILNYITGLK